LQGKYLNFLIYDSEKNAEMRRAAIISLDILRRKAASRTD
jgi:hypothetical protein